MGGSALDYFSLNAHGLLHARGTPDSVASLLVSEGRSQDTYPRPLSLRGSGTFGYRFWLEVR